MRARADAGFTLVELLVSVALIGLLTMIMFETVHFATNGYARRLSASDRIESQSGSASELRALLEGMLPMTFASEKGELLMYFAGGAESVRFVAPASVLGGGVGGLEMVTLELSPERDGEARKLIARRRPFGLGGGEQPEAVVTLADGLEGLELAYYGVPEDAEPGVIAPEKDAEWTDEWAERAALPELVRVQIKEAGGRVWPLLITAPKARHAPE